MFSYSFTRSAQLTFRVNAQSGRRVMYIWTSGRIYSEPSGVRTAHSLAVATGGSPGVCTAGPLGVCTAGQRDARSHLT